MGCAHCRSQPMWRTRGVEAGGEPGGTGIGADRHLGQRCNGDRLCTAARDHARGVRARNQGDLSRTSSRHNRGAETDAAARSWHHRQFSSALAYRSVPLQSVYCGDRRFHRQRAIRADPRQEEHPSDVGGPPSGEHPAILLGAEQNGTEGALGGADLPARGSRTRHLLRSFQQAPKSGWVCPRSWPSWETK